MNITKIVAIQLSAFDYTEKQLDNLIVSLYNGDIDPLKLPESLYLAVSKHIVGGVEKGFGGSVAFSAVDTELRTALHENVYLFSGAKTFNFTLEASDALYSKKGDLLPFEEFKEKANQVFEKYHGQIENGKVRGGWLEAEYNTALSQGGHIKKWNQIQETKHLMPYLRRNEIEDSHECIICKSVNGVCLPVDHPFWRENGGDLHYNCRGIIEQVEREEGENLKWADKDVEEATKKSDAAGRSDAFKFNPGMQKEVFSTEGKSKHPYFEVPKPYKKFAEKNFDLPIPALKQPKLTKAQQTELDNLPRQKTHSQEESKLQEKSLRQYVTQKESLVEKYISSEGKVVNTDEARKLFDGYNGLNANAVHEASSALGKAATKQLLETGKHNKVTMYAGGAGSGKTSAIKQLIPDIQKGTDVIIDGNMASYKGAISKIDQYLTMGKKLDIDYVYREPVDAWERGVISRMLNNKAEMGRIVPLSTFIENTTGSLKTVKELIANGVDEVKGVNIKLIDNSMGKDKAAFMTKEKFKTIEYPNNLREILEKRTKELFDEGKISKIQLEGLLK